MKQVFKTVRHVREALKDVGENRPRTPGASAAFRRRIGNALTLLAREPEILLFALLQWLAVALGYFLWIQMLDWIPDEVWKSAVENDGGSVADYVLLAWSFLCVGVAAFPIGLLTGAMGAAHIQNRSGGESTVAGCLRMVVPRAGTLWAFHWADGWITVTQIVERLPSRDDVTHPGRRAVSEALYYAWKLGTAGMLPNLLAGKGLLESGKASIGFVRKRLIDVALLRAGYSTMCWIVGISAWLGMLVLVKAVDIVPPNEEIYAYVYEIYAWAALPVLVAVGIVMLLLRPVYVIALSDLYADYREEIGETTEVATVSRRSARAFVLFLFLVVAVALIYWFREPLGVMNWLAVPYRD